MFFRASHNENSNARIVHSDSGNEVTGTDFGICIPLLCEDTSVMVNSKCNLKSTQGGEVMTPLNKRYDWHKKQL